MPEGDTVYRAATHLNRALAGREITASDFRVPKLATVDLSGRVTDEVVPVGKHILHRIGDITLHTHFGMDGSWHLYRPGQRWQRPAHTARVILNAKGIVAVGFDLAELELIRRESEQDAIGHLCPDLLHPQWDAAMAAEAATRLADQPEREIAAALLDQRTMAGLGNEYVNEICFLLGTHPRAQVADAGDTSRIVELARSLILTNRDRVERATTGDPRPGRRTFVYGRAGRPCLRCGTRIREDRHGAGARGGRQRDDRVSYFCPSCQPLPVA